MYWTGIDQRYDSVQYGGSRASSQFWGYGKRQDYSVAAPWAGRRTAVHAVWMPSPTRPTEPARLFFRHNPRRRGDCPGKRLRRRSGPKERAHSHAHYLLPRAAYREIGKSHMG